MPENDHDAGTREVLEEAAAIRRRPGMYVGSNANGGALHSILWELINNAVDEHLRGGGQRVVVTLHDDGSAKVEDEGRGLPMEPGPGGIPVSELVFGGMHRDHGQKQNNKAKRHSQTRGIGVFATSALSEELSLTVRRGGKVWRQVYRQGKPQAPPAVVDATDRTGTSVSFRPDLGIFSGVTRFSIVQIVPRMLEIAALCPSLTLELHHDGVVDVFHAPRGLISMVERLCQGRATLLPLPARFSVEESIAPHGLIRAEIVLQWLEEPLRDSHPCGPVFSVSFLNNRHTPDGGTHVAGVRTGVKQGAEDVASREGLLGRHPWTQVAQWISERTIFAVHVEHPSPQMSSRTREKLVSSEVLALVRQAVRLKTVALLVEHPGIAAGLVRPPAG